MKKIVLVSLVLCSLFAFVANSNANGNEQMSNDSSIYQLNIEFDSSEYPFWCEFYTGRLRVDNMYMNATYYEEVYGYGGSYIFNLPLGAYIIDGEGSCECEDGEGHYITYQWSVVPQMVFVPHIQAVTVRLELEK